MAKPNYSFEKRQRELAKKKKKEEKAVRKSLPGSPEAAADVVPGGAAGETPTAAPDGALPAPSGSEPSP